MDINFLCIFKKWVPCRSTDFFSSGDNPASPLRSLSWFYPCCISEVCACGCVGARACMEVPLSARVVLWSNENAASVSVHCVLATFLQDEVSHRMFGLRHGHC